MRLVVIREISYKRTKRQTDRQTDRQTSERWLKHNQLGGSNSSRNNARVAEICRARYESVLSMPNVMTNAVDCKLTFSCLESFAFLGTTDMGHCRRLNIEQSPPLPRTTTMERNGITRQHS